MKTIILALFMAGNVSAQTSIVTDFGITKSVGNANYVLSPTETRAQSFTDKLGIGTTATANRLHVQDNGASGATSGSPTGITIERGGGSGAFLNLNTTSAGSGNIYFNDNVAGRGVIEYNHATDSIRFIAAATEIMRLVGGNVGIGTTAPASKLDISSGTITLAGTGAPSAGYALCLTATKQIGRCSNTPAADGACTCAVN